MFTTVDNNSDRIVKMNAADRTSDDMELLLQLTWPTRRPTVPWKVSAFFCLKHDIFPWLDTIRRDRYSGDIEDYIRGQ